MRRRYYGRPGVGRVDVPLLTKAGVTFRRIGRFVGRYAGFLRGSHPTTQKKGPRKNYETLKDHRNTGSRWAPNVKRVKDDSAEPQEVPCAGECSSAQASSQYSVLLNPYRTNKRWAGFFPGTAEKQWQVSRHCNFAATSYPSREKRTVTNRAKEPQMRTGSLADQKPTRRNREARQKLSKQQKQSSSSSFSYTETTTRPTASLPVTTAVRQPLPAQNKRGGGWPTIPRACAPRPKVRRRQRRSRRAGPNGLAWRSYEPNRESQTQQHSSHSERGLLLSVGPTAACSHWLA